MRFYYGEKNYLRLLDEGEFWKLQEEEHTVVIRKIAPDLEMQYVDRLREMEKKFRVTKGHMIKYAETVNRNPNDLSYELVQNIMKLMHHALNESLYFVEFLNHLLENSLAVKNNMVAQVVVKHIIRESEYFIGIVQTILYL